MKWLYRICRLFRAPRCMHMWVNREFTVMNKRDEVIKLQFVLKCHKCGDMKTLKTSVLD